MCPIFMKKSNKITPIDRIKYLNDEIICFQYKEKSDN